ncbi:MAG: hypothetical protein HOK36_02630, partial [Rhodospirillales bacterium]|nr:hypothetical protein [Rhodospirillales bacterium]
MITVDDLVLAEIADTQDINGIPFPAEPRFRQFLVTGPPGAGKSTLIMKMRGWPYEGYLDLSLPNWWRNPELTFRPREIHLGAPFKGHDEALTVIDEEWLDESDILEMDFSRIAIPPAKTWLFGTDWRNRFVFEFVLPPADIVFEDRVGRAKSGLFPHDRRLSHDLVVRQIDFYRTIAWYFWVCGMRVYVRTEREGTPMRIVESRKGLETIVSQDGLTPTWQPQTPAIQKGFSPFAGIIKLFSKKQGGITVTPEREPTAIEEPVRISWANGAFALNLGSVTLELHPDLTVGGDSSRHAREWIILGGTSFHEDVPQFIRLGMGKSLMMGRGDELQCSLFNYDDTVATRHVELINVKGNLTIRALDKTHVSTVSALDNPPSIWQERRRNLLRLPDVLGRDLVGYGDDEAFAEITKVNT